MVAKVIVVSALVLLVAAVLYLKTLEYMVEARREREETERQQLERDEALVAEAEREYRRNR